MHPRILFAAISVALVFAACGSGSSVPTSSSSTAASIATASSPVASAVASAEAATPVPSTAPSAAASPSSFTSKSYGYSLTVPAGWSVTPSSKKWDGISAPPFAAPEGDKFEIPGPASAAGMSSPTSKDLAGYVQDRIAANQRDHADTCPPVPETSDPIEIDGEPATLLSWDCGILINLGITVHDGIGYLFGMRDPDVHAASDPTDRALFMNLLTSVQFPD